MIADSQQLKGNTELLILASLAGGPKHGYRIAREIEGTTQGYFSLKEGSLYPALHRLEAQRALSGSWRLSEEGRRRRYYALTRAGKKLLRQKRREWSAFAAAMTAVLEV